MPLHLEHGPGTPVGECQPTPNGAARTLDEDAAGGAAVFVINDRQGLGPGDVLRFGTHDPVNVVDFRLQTP